MTTNVFAGVCKKSPFFGGGGVMIEMLDYGYVEVRNKTTNVCNEKHLTAAS